VEKERKKDNSDVVTAQIMVLLRFQVGPGLFVILKWAL
jgi:hypothetical protein